LGSVWSLGRPLVYRSIDILVEHGLIEPAGHEPGIRGPNRTNYRTTCAGATALVQWLVEPVEHVRDVRSLLLLKLIFAERTGIDPSPMLEAQQATIRAAASVLETRMRASIGTEAILLRFRPPPRPLPHPRRVARPHDLAARARGRRRRAPARVRARVRRAEGRRSDLPLLARRAGDPERTAEAEHRRRRPRPPAADRIAG